jgi:ABC-type uncharacterized transport system ATPase subunit
MDLQTVLRRAPDSRYRRVQDEGVVIRQSTAEALVVNELGARLLDLIDGQTAIQGLVDQLEKEYEVERSRLETDVLAYLGELERIGLVTAQDD